MNLSFVCDHYQQARLLTLDNPRIVGQASDQIVQFVLIYSSNLLFVCHYYWQITILGLGSLEMLAIISWGLYV